MGDDSLDTGQFFCFGCVDIENAGMGMRAVQQFAHQHILKLKIPCIPGPPGCFRNPIETG